MEDREKILQRIKKMMALANDRAASSGERENALAMVSEILNKYNLTMAEADAQHLGNEEKRIKEGIFEKKYGHAWCRNIANAIAQLYFCHYFITQSNKGQKVEHYFVGKQSNVFTAQEMTKYVLDSIMKEARQEAREQEQNGAFERNFCKGASISIINRCHKMVEEAKKAKAPKTANNCTALILASVYDAERAANKKMLVEMKIRLKSNSDHQRSSSPDGFTEGRIFGGRISLNTQLGGAKSSTLRIT